MRDILYPDHTPAEADPVKRAQAAMARQPLPKRFYMTVTIVEEGDVWALKLDGRGARTPAGKTLALPSPKAARLLAMEWEAQKDRINPETMPVTRIVNSALDGVSARMDEVRQEIAGYAGSDLVCYRATEPDSLVMAQAHHWNPVVQWAEAAFGAHFTLATGIIHTEQPREALDAVSTAVRAIKDPAALAALHVMTTISGSCLIAWMASRGALTCPEAWDAATVDEAWNISHWGQDAEASARMVRRQADFNAAYGLFQALA